ncbi:hypothetical protein D3C78_1678560 [compost metagenome]
MRMVARPVFELELRLPEQRPIRWIVPRSRSAPLGPLKMPRTGRTTGRAGIFPSSDAPGALAPIGHATP